MSAADEVFDVFFVDHAPNGCAEHHHEVGWLRCDLSMHLR